jgi:hypothetical protein
VREKRVGCTNSARSTKTTHLQGRSSLRTLRGPPGARHPTRPATANPPTSVASSTSIPKSAREWMLHVDTVKPSSMASEARRIYLTYVDARATWAYAAPRSSRKGIRQTWTSAAKIAAARIEFAMATVTRDIGYLSLSRGSPGASCTQTIATRGEHRRMRHRYPHSRRAVIRTGTLQRDRERSAQPSAMDHCRDARRVATRKTREIGRGRPPHFPVWAEDK